MQHWSRPLAQDRHTRWPYLTVDWRSLSLGGRALCPPLFGAARALFDTLPRATRGLAAALACTLSLGTLSALAMQDGGERGGATPVAALDPLAALRVNLPPAVSGAGAAVQAPGDGVTLAAPDPAAPGGAPAVQVAGSTATATASTLDPLPVGKGMWFHLLEQTGITPEQIVEQARATGLTHLYLRLGSSKMGFHGRADLDRLLPAAHAAGIRVVGWDFPYLHDPVADAARALEEIAYTTPGGQRIDAFSADIETGSEGVALAAERVDLYGAVLRWAAGPGYPLVGTVPNACLNASYPYAEVARHFSALAPMVYWITRDPGTDVACNLERLTPLGRPVLPVGQAYDPAIDNPVLVGLTPGYDHLRRFMQVAAERGAPGVSFWAWHTATPDMWRAITDTRW